MSRVIPPLVIALGIIAAGAALLLAPSPTLTAATDSWRPFVLVTGLLLVGSVAHEEGFFDAISAPLARIPSGIGLYVGAMTLVAVVTVVLNLDTSVAFLTPVLVLAARRRQVPDAPLLYGCVFMSNAASLLLPGSNLTNLLVLGGEHVQGGTFALRMLPAWVAAVVVTAIVPPLFLRGGLAGPAAPDGGRPRLPPLSTAAVLGAGVAVVASADPAPLVFGLGLALALVQVARRRLSPRATYEAVGPVLLFGLFGITVGLGALARVWSGPAMLLAHSGRLGTALLGAVAAPLLNNLPAAVLLGSAHPTHARALLVGLNLGPNLAVSGSLSAVLWWRASQLVSAHPSAATYSRIGLILVPLSLAGAVIALNVLAPAQL
ncbi:MAG: SLC13 family permease [Candidatus Dormibacteria bacterium]